MSKIFKLTILVICIFLLVFSYKDNTKDSKNKPEIKKENDTKNIIDKDIKKKGIQMFEYKTKNEIKPNGLIGISDNQINDHWKLYEGYVKQVNTINKELKELSESGKTDSLIYADRRRRYGFEYNGMILHEYYFENLKKPESIPTINENILKKGALLTSIEQTWGSFDAWKQDFIATGKTRGIGWAILYLDSKNMQLTNHFIAEHQDGIISGFKPILVMDVWEHAYMVDHSATDRAKYIDAFLQNINWDVIEKRFS